MVSDRRDSIIIIVHTGNEIQLSTQIKPLTTSGLLSTSDRALSPASDTAHVMLCSEYLLRHTHT